MSSKKIPKSLRDYLSKIKTPQRSQIQLPSKKWILMGCKHPRTPSLDIDKIKNTPYATANNNNIKDEEAMLADIDRFLFENFKSLFLEDRDETANNNNRREEKSPKLSPIRFDSSRRYEESPPNLFMETTTEAGSSSAVSSSGTEGAEEQTVVPGNCVVVLANSASPGEDFRRSMEGVVEARLRNCEKVDWDFMEELLFCHMNLNQKKAHKFILSAFVDVVTAMRRPPEMAPAKPKPRSVRTVRIGREVRKKTKEYLEFGPR
ncbi:Transcription repressor OFP14 [Spatholobus suberectus]|nr:Transcription repressor OFP14 [Spatholobus suberectus]